MKPPSPPSASDTDYPAYQRMLANLKAMTVAPHPSGSAELEGVRSYLLDQIHAMGLEATVETEFYTMKDIEADMAARQAAEHKEISKPQPRNETSSNASSESNELEDDIHFNENGEVVLKNILVKLDAPGTDRGILMAAHYDTKNRTPGAADDMISVSAMLEAIREQAGNTGLRNDLYFLFTDGEELGALGAKAFVAAHPELKSSIDLVVNLEARGNRGGLLMFETSAWNYDAVRYYQAAVSRPVAFSFTAALYRQMPNGTDLSRFLEAGYPGLNFAAAEGVEHYHQPTDNFENLDRGTAYHFLQTALEIADYGARVPFPDNSSNRDSVYFPFLPGHIMSMSSVAATLVSGIAGLSAVLWLVMQIRLGRVRIRQMIENTGWLIGTIAVMTLLSWGIVSWSKWIIPDSHDEVFLCQIFLFGLAALTVFTFRMRKQSLTEALAGLLPFQLLLIVGTTVFFNEGSYLFTLPTLAILIVAAMGRLLFYRLAASAVLGVGLLLLYVPVCWLIYVMLMLPLTPVVIALSAVPLCIIAAAFSTRYKA